ncbi:DUF257 family protein [Thermococcus sp.]
MKLPFVGVTTNESLNPFSLGGGRIINPVLGIEKIFFLAGSKREILTTVNAVLAYTGDERRIAVYFINIDLLKNNTPYILPLLEEIATTVIKVTRENKSFKFSVVKSVGHDIEGIEVKV